MTDIKAQLLLWAIGMMGAPTAPRNGCAASSMQGLTGLALEGISTADVARSEAEK